MEQDQQQETGMDPDQKFIVTVAAFITVVIVAIVIGVNYASTIRNERVRDASLSCIHRGGQWVEVTSGSRLCIGAENIERLIP